MSLESWELFYFDAERKLIEDPARSLLVMEMAFSRGPSKYCRWVKIAPI